MLVLTRSEVIDVRSFVTVAEITTSIRGIAAEVTLDAPSVGLSRESVINCDGLHTVAQSTLHSLVGEVDAPTMRRACAAVTYALGC